MARRKSAVRKLKDYDDILYLFTGSRASTIGKRVLSVFGDKIRRAVFNDNGDDEMVDDPDDPYVILGVRRDASDFVVKAAYREFAKKTHPDATRTQESTAFQKCTEAYNKIMQERHGQPPQP